MQNDLPRQIDVSRPSNATKQLQGRVLIANLPRLSSFLWRNEGEAHAQLEFGKDLEGICFLQGQIEAKLILQCQRCMQEFVYAIIARPVIGVVANEAKADSLPDRYEPVLAQDGIVSLWDMVEDELILSLPTVAMHDPEDCSVKLESDVSEPEVVKKNPFAVLSSIQSNVKRDK